MSAVDPHGVARMLFARHDADGSGHLDVDELWALCTELGHSLTLGEVEMAVAKLDGDGNGTLSVAEFLKWYDIGLSSAMLFDDQKRAEFLEQRRKAHVSPQGLNFWPTCPLPTLS